MHSQDFEYTDDDLRYTDDDDRLTRIEVTFHYNSDLSGEVHINRAAEGGEGVSRFDSILIPGWMLIEFVGRHVNSETISMLEDMSGTETLEFLRGNK